MYADSHQFIIQWHSQKGIISSTPRENSENSPYYDIRNGGYTLRKEFQREQILFFKSSPYNKRGKYILSSTFICIHSITSRTANILNRQYDCMGWLDSSLSAWALRPFLSSLAQFSFGPHQAKSAFEHAQKVQIHIILHMHSVAVSQCLIQAFAVLWNIL